MTHRFAFDQRQWTREDADQDAFLVSLTEIGVETYEPDSDSFVAVESHFRTRLDEDPDYASLWLICGDNEPNAFGYSAMLALSRGQAIDLMMALGVAIRELDMRMPDRTW